MTNYLIVLSKGGAGGGSRRGELGCKVRRGEQRFGETPPAGCRGGSLTTHLFPRGVPPACCSGPGDICSWHGGSSLPSLRGRSHPPTHPCMPPRADVSVPGSCLRGERQACLMCDETESSEPLGGSGSKGGKRGRARVPRKTGPGRGGGGEYREEGMLG